MSRTKPWVLLFRIDASIHPPFLIFIGFPKIYLKFINNKKTRSKTEPKLNKCIPPSQEMSLLVFIDYILTKIYMYYVIAKILKKLYHQKLHLLF